MASSRPMTVIQGYQSPFNMDSDDHETLLTCSRLYALEVSRQLEHLGFPTLNFAIRSRSGTVRAIPMYVAGRLRF